MTKALFGLPEQVVFCKRCVISNQRPNSTVEFKNVKDEEKATINFDEDEMFELEKIKTNISDSISILIEKKLDLFSSTVNNKK